VSGEPADPVRVWVTYQKGGKIAVLSALTRQNAEIHYDFPELDAYVVTLPSAALNGIWRNPFVTDIEPDPVRYPIEPVRVELDALFADTKDVNGQNIPWGIDAVQARDVWDADRNAIVDADAPTGAGIKVCIIDTGYYAGHDDLKDQSTGISQVDDDYLNDGGAHGSHVAGTISALNNEFGVVGVSPGAVDLHIVKIFDNDGLWTSASNLVDAIYNCRDNGANVISMSLGGASSNRREQRAFDTLYSNGILHVAAAGNEQVETPGAMSYPASYSSVISVAATDSDNLIADFSLQNSAVEIAAPGVDVLSTIPYIETNDLVVNGVSYDAAHIEFSAFGTASGELVDGGLCTSSGSWNDKVVLCQRGDISFLEKVQAVYNGGGAAAIVYNNEPGNFLGTLGEEPSFNMVAISISQEDGLYLVNNKMGQIADISSTHVFPANGYEAWGGTSMATPHVSGVAALIWSANPGWTNVQIREAMNETAYDLGATGRDSIFGYGLVQAKNALTYLGGGVVDNPPSVTITSPTAGATLSDTVPVSATASDDNGVTSVAFFVDGANIGTDTNGSDGWTTSWNTTAFADGTYVLSATATDTAGKTGVDSINVTVQNDTPTDNPPTVSITDPGDGETVADTLTVTANATDDHGVTQVEFLVDGESLGVDTEDSDGWGLTWDTNSVDDGSHTISAVATDTIGQTTSDSISVTVDNSGGTTDPIVLTASARKIRGAGVVSLNWGPITSTYIDIIRNGSKIATPLNTGDYTDNDLGKGGGSATYQVCEAGTQTCSNEVTVSW
jgi:subtilisin family serine protease